MAKAGAVLKSIEFVAASQKSIENQSVIQEMA